jgi:hypothetical protein
MERLKGMKERLIHCVESQVYGNLEDIDAKELGEAIDMIKDLEEAIYYCTITKAMKEGNNGKEEKHHNQEQMYYPYYMTIDRDIDRPHGRMYYPNNYQNNGNQMPNGTRHYPMEIRDYREGKSPMSRRTYMESKEMHKDGRETMHELDKYMQELSQDVVEMIEKATPEEKQLLQQKLTMLASKVK